MHFLDVSFALTLLAKVLNFVCKGEEDHFKHIVGLSKQQLV
jgi:hypothetical protein